MTAALISSAVWYMLRGNSVLTRLEYWTSPTLVPWEETSRESTTWNMGTGTLSVCPRFLCKHYRLSQILCDLFHSYTAMNLSTRGVQIRKQLCGRCCPPGSQTSWPAQSFEGGHSWSHQSEAPGRCFQTCRLKREKLGLITGIIKWHNVHEFVFQTEIETHKQPLLWFYVKMLHLLACLSPVCLLAF